MKYGNNPGNYLVAEFADGIFQRETAMLLRCPEVRSSVHKIVFCAADAAGAAGGLRMLEETFDLIPNAISGACSSSPLAVREIASFSDLPVLRSLQRDYKAIYAMVK